MIFVPERRFTFDLGVDADDDPIEAMAVGVDSLSKLPFVLDDPEPNAIISTVGDSNIVITFMAWVDQRTSDFGKSRSLAIRAAKAVLEEAGFTLPEPIYRLRIDPREWNAAPTANVAQATKAKSEAPTVDKKGSPLNDSEAVEAMMDVSPDRHLEDKVNEERTLNTDSDLLDNDRPIE